MEKGQKITYTKEFMFGKTGEETATIVAIIPSTRVAGAEIILLDNGYEFEVITCGGKIFTTVK